MVKLPNEKISYWLDSVPASGYPALTEDTTVDVVVIGAGIVGLTTAYLLKKSGKRVVVLEKDTVGAGVSGHTTAKITSQHNLIYAKLYERLGAQTARLYGEANQTALDKIAEIIEAESIDCDFRWEDNYVYTTDQQKIAQFKDEALIAASLGLPASYETETDLPFAVAASVKFSNQATFHIQKYLLALARLVDGDGSHVYEQSRAIGIRDGAPGQVRTTKAKLQAGSIIVATNVPTLPLMARGGYCAYEYPHQSYIVAAKVKRPIKGMYISPDKQHYSIHPVPSGRDNYLLFGGENHIPGSRWNPRTRYQRLADYAEKHFGVSQIDYRWSHHDYLGYDDMPLVGKVYPWSQNLYTATGFMKWGMTNGTAAAMLMHDLVLGQTSPWAGIFKPNRLQAVRAIPKVIAEQLG